MSKQSQHSRIAAVLIVLLCLWQCFVGIAYADDAVNTAKPLNDVQQALDKALDYLEAAVTEPMVGSIGGEWAVLALAQNGRLTQQTSTAYFKSLQERLNAEKGVLSARKSTEYSRVIRVLAALEYDPTNVAGYNLLTPLEDFEFVCTQGLNGPIWALLALDSGGFALTPSNKNGTTREKLIDYLLEHQLPEGGWGLAEEPDDLTAMAIEALAPYYRQRTDVTQAVDTALERLSECQQADGGFWKSGGSESVSQAILALSALGQSWLEGPRFAKNGNTAVDALLQYQNPDGSFCHVLGGKSDLMATEQAILALTAYCCTTQTVSQAEKPLQKWMWLGAAVLAGTAVAVDAVRRKKREKNSE